MGSASSKPATISRPTPSHHLSEKPRDVDELSDACSDLTISHGPTAPDGTLTACTINHWETGIASNPKLQLGRTVLSRADLKQALQSRSAHIADQHVFNTELDFKTGPITDQKSSGRCWLFATTNVLRYNVMKKLKMKDFQLSQAYLFFWDKLNKCNYYLELAIENAELPIEDRLVSYLSDDLISDGGQWDMVVNLLEAYGVVPQAIYPESFSSSRSGPLNNLIKTKLREHGLVLRSLSKSLRAHSGAHSELSDKAILETLRAKKETLMRDIYTIMSAAMGVIPSPDEKFVWDYYDKDEKPARWEGTPKEFYQKVAVDKYSPADSFSIINDPRNEYGKLYTVDKLGNLWGARPVLYVNTEIENLKNAVVTMIKAGQSVFFGCDVGQFSDSTLGIMDTALFDYENAFDITLGLSKADRLQVHESSMTHAMVISGVHLDPATGKPTRYKVENSWGEERGNKGYFVMTDQWFEEFVFQVVIPKALAPKELVKVFEGGDCVVLPPWDPMGSLA